ncbi:MAG: alpha/beta fold hydrolase, partial [Actinomycetota bacterium]
MDIDEYVAAKRTVRLPQGDVAYAEFGEGPAALFVHGVFLNGLLWRKAIDGLRSERRCIAIDLPAHGDTHADLGEGFSLEAHAALLADFLDEIGIDAIDLIGNDTGGAICQVFAVRFPARVRTLTLTNCDVDQNFPPEAFTPSIELAQQGELAPVLAQLATDIELARSDVGFGVGYQHSEALTEEVVDSFLGRYADPEAGREIERRVAAVAGEDLSVITPQMRALTIPTLVVWGTNDQFFALDWAYWLRDNVPGVTKVVE